MIVNKNTMYAGVAIAAIVGTVVLVGMLIAALKSLLPLILLGAVGFGIYWAVKKFG